MVILVLVYDTGSAKDGERTEELQVFDFGEISHHIAVHVGFDVSQVTKVANFRVTRAMRAVQGVVVGASRVTGLADVSCLVDVQTVLREGLQT